MATGRSILIVFQWWDLSVCAKLQGCCYPFPELSWACRSNSYIWARLRISCLIWWVCIRMENIFAFGLGSHARHEVLWLFWKPSSLNGNFFPQYYLLLALPSVQEWYKDRTLQRYGLRSEPRYCRWDISRTVIFDCSFQTLIPLRYFWTSWIRCIPKLPTTSTPLCSWGLLPSVDGILLCTGYRFRLSGRTITWSTWEAVSFLVFQQLRWRSSPSVWPRRPGRGAWNRRSGPF